jgi:tripeptide aminopeptidase
MFCEHLDTVDDTKNLKILRDGDYLTSDGTTILGADNRGAITSIVSAIKYIRKNNIPHRKIEILFTVAEELSVMGSSALDYDMFESKTAIVIDGGGKVGKIYRAAPEHHAITFNFYGRGAHAGMAPENGISAIVMAARAIAQMPNSRIDHETTANVGIIHGGVGTNVVCDHVYAKGEVRSHDHDKLMKQLDTMKQIAIDTANDMGGRVEISTEMMYPSFNIDTDHPIFDRVAGIFTELGIKTEVTTTGGGSDANYLNNNGIYTLLLSAGYENAHSKHERFYIPDLVNLTKLIIKIVT